MLNHTIAESNKKINEKFYTEEIQNKLDRAKRFDEYMVELLAHKMTIKESLGEMEDIINKVWSEFIENNSQDIRGGQS